MKKINRLPSLSRVSPGNTATLELPLGPTYERIVFSVSAGAALDVTDIGRIRVMIDGKERQTFKNLQRLMDINEYYKRGADTVGATAAEFVLHFNRRELVDNIMRNAPGLGTADVSTLHIEIEIAAAAPADIAIKATAQVDPVRQNIGTFFNIREFPASSPVSGVFEHDKFPRGAHYAAIHLFKADISAVEMEANGVKMVDATKAVLERLQKEANNARAPLTAKATHIDLLTDGNLFDGLPSANLQDLRLKMTLDTSGAVDIVTETLDTL